MAAWNRPHSTTRAIPDWLNPAIGVAPDARPDPVPEPGPDPEPDPDRVPPPTVPKPTDPCVNSRPAHCRLNTPLIGLPPAPFGNSAVARLFQVICGTMASTRWS